MGHLGEVARSVGVMVGRGMVPCVLVSLFDFVKLSTCNCGTRKRNNDGTII